MTRAVKRFGNVENSLRGGLKFYSDIRVSSHGSCHSQSNPAEDVMQCSSGLDGAGPSAPQPAPSFCRANGIAG